MSVNSQIRQAELEIKAWTCPGTPVDRMVEGLMDGYSTRSEPERKAFVAALVGQVAGAAVRAELDRSKQQAAA